MVKSRNILFQGAGHSVSEGFPGNSVLICPGVQGHRANPPLQPRPSWNWASANTADALPGEKVLGSQLDRVSQCSLEYFNTSHLLNSLGSTLLQESIWLYTCTVLKKSCSSCAKLTLCRNEELKHVIALPGGRMLSVVSGVHPLMPTQLWIWCPLCNMPIPLSAGEIPHPSNCSEHLKDNLSAWHIAAATEMLCDALRAR